MSTGTPPRRPLVIWGCGGFGRELFDLCRQLELEIVGALDERPEWAGRVVDGVPVLGDLAAIDDRVGEVEVVCTGVGDPALKRHFLERTRAAGHHIAAPIVHPSVRIPPGLRIGEGTVVCQGVVFTVGIRVGRHVLLNLGCTVGHDCEIGDFSTVSPLVALSGNVRIGEGAYIGTNSAIRDKLEVGAWSVVGGGAFVAKDVPPRTLVGGVPARHLKNL